MLYDLDFYIKREIEFTFQSKFKILNYTFKIIS